MRAVWGQPSSIYLAAAGVGTIGMVDDDVVDLSNLQRQIVHPVDRVGTLKVESASKTLKGLNPDVNVVQHPVRLTSDNVLDIIGRYDVIVDGADNFQTRYLLNDAALKLGKPVLHASIFRFEGQLNPVLGRRRTLLPLSLPRAATAREWRRPAPKPASWASCPVSWAFCRRLSAIKVILGLGKTLAGRLLVYDALNLKFRELRLRADPECPTCGEGVDRSKIELIDYLQFCNVGR